MIENSLLCMTPHKLSVLLKAWFVKIITSTHSHIEMPQLNYVFHPIFIKKKHIKHKSLSSFRLLTWLGLQQFFVFLDNKIIQGSRRTINVQVLIQTLTYHFQFLFPTKFLFLIFYFNFCLLLSFFGDFVFCFCFFF